MMVNTEGFELSCSQGTQASQTWDEEDEYWACDADADLEGSKAECDDDDNGCPTKQAQWAGTWNSNLVQVVSDEISIGHHEIPTVFPENCHHCVHTLDELK